MAEITPDGQVKVEWYMRHGATFVKDYVWATGGTPAIPASPGVPEVPAVPAVPVNMTGWKGRAHIRDKLNSETILVELTTENGGMTLGSAGQIHIEVSATQTKGMSLYKKAVTDVELESPSGFVRNLIGADIILGSNVTREI